MNAISEMATQEYRIVTGEDSEIHDEPHIEGSRLTVRLEIPAEVTTIDALDHHVTPGLVDAHSHAGIAEWGEPEDADINEGTDPVTPQVNAIDGFHPRDGELKRAFQGGVTTVSARMGMIGGVICSMKTYGDVADEMCIREDGMKAAMDENPQRFHGERKDRQPSTRSGVAATLRQALTSAEDYAERRAHAAEEGESFERDLGLANLARVVEGDLALRAHAHRADDIVTAFRIADEFDITTLSIEHATEGHLVAEEFAKRDMPAVCGPSLYSGAKYELRNITFETPGLLHEAGVTVAIQTDAPVLPQEHLDVCVGLTIREGLPEAVALRTVTAIPPKSWASKSGLARSNRVPTPTSWSGTDRRSTSVRVPETCSSTASTPTIALATTPTHARSGPDSRRPRGRRDPDTQRRGERWSPTSTDIECDHEP